MKPLMWMTTALIALVVLALLASPLKSDQPQPGTLPNESSIEADTTAEPTLRWSPEGALLPPMPLVLELRRQAQERIQADISAPAAISGAKRMTVERQPLTGVPRRANMNAFGAPQVGSRGASPPLPDKVMSVYMDFPGGRMINDIPPSTDLAVGPDHVVQTVNCELRVYDKCGTYLIGTDFNTWLNDTTHDLKDARIIYDHWGDRWCMVVGGPNYSMTGWVLYLVWSDSDDPEGAWSYLQLPTRSGWNTFAYDVGSDPFRVYVTANQVLGTWATHGPRLWILDSYDLYTQPLIRYNYVEELVDPCCEPLGYPATIPASSDWSSHIRTPVVHDWNGLYWMVNSRPNGGDNLTVRMLTFPAPLVPDIWAWEVPCNPYVVAPTMVQPLGSPLDAGSCRLQNAAYKNGRIWTGMTVETKWGAVSGSAIRIFQINCSPGSTGGGIGLTPLAPEIATETDHGQWEVYYAYPAVDVEAGALLPPPQTRSNAIVTFARCGPGVNQFPSVGYIDFYPNGNFGSENLLFQGVEEFRGGTPPYPWGRYFDVQLDPWDETTLWFTGGYGDDTYVPFGWSSHIGAMSFDGGPVLHIVDWSPEPVFEVHGVEGGPFTPADKNYMIWNEGGAGLYWEVIGIPSWLTMTFPYLPRPGTVEHLAPNAGKIKGRGDVSLPGHADDVLLTVNATAEDLPPGIYEQEFEFISCNATSSYNTVHTARLIVSDPPPFCPGAEVELDPPGVPPPGVTSGNVDRGVVFRPLEDFELRCVGVQFAGASPTILSARLYEGSRLSTYTLLWEDERIIYDPTSRFQMVAVSPVIRLDACATYELAFDIGDVTAMWGWDETAAGGLPYDAEGLFRVDDLTENGSDGNIILQYRLRGDELHWPPPYDTELVRNPPPPYPSSTETNVDRGIFATAKKTIRLRGIGIYGDFPVGEALLASCYERTAGARSAVLAQRTITVASAGEQWHDVRMSAELKEGQDLDVGFSIANTVSWQYQTESAAMVPFFTANEDFEVVEGEDHGHATTDDMPRLRLYYEYWPYPCDCTDKAGCFVDLGTPGPTSTSAEDSVSRGLYFTALADQSLFGVEWRAALPEKSPVVARLYAAPGGVRDSLLTQSVIRSGTEEDTWHVFPLAAELISGRSYDLEITWFAATGWEYWGGTSVEFPYDIGQKIRVTSPELGGVPGATELLHVGLDSRLVGPVSTVNRNPLPKAPAVGLRVYPTPFNAGATLEVVLNAGTEIKIVVSDARGRRVREVVSGWHDYGVHPYSWDGRDDRGSPVSSGMYLACVIVNDDIVASSKLLLVK